MNRFGIRAEVIQDSISESGVRLTTMQLRYHRFIHSEFMTHRVFSRNASSSRAVPVKRQLELLRAGEYAEPVEWGKNQAGMQAKEVLDGVERHEARLIWQDAMHDAIERAEQLVAWGVHKQIVNRLLEPFTFINVIVTATEWSNFFELRCHPDAQPEMQMLASEMREAMNRSTPTLVRNGVWHVPYVYRMFSGYQSSVMGHDVFIHGQRAVDPGQFDGYRIQDGPTSWRRVSLEEALMSSAAMCARVSYLRHEGGHPTLEENIDLFKRLVGSQPQHASPVEHQARPMNFFPRVMFKNFRGWRQFREIVEEGLDWKILAETNAA